MIHLDVVVVDVRVSKVWVWVTNGGNLKLSAGYAYGWVITKRFTKRTSYEVIMNFL